MFRYYFLIPRYIIRNFYIYYNRMKLKVAGAHVGHNCKIFNGFYILVKKGGGLNIGDNFKMQSGSCFNPLVRGAKSSIYVSNKGVVTIGDNSGISSSCIWCIDSIKIGDYVDIGANCVIVKGANISDNSVIGAGSIVNCDVPSNTIFIQKRENTIINMK